jgi:hypothetical protein
MRLLKGAIHLELIPLTLVALVSGALADGVSENHRVDDSIRGISRTKIQAVACHSAPVLSRGIKRGCDKDQGPLLAVYNTPSASLALSAFGLPWAGVIARIATRGGAWYTTGDVPVVVSHIVALEYCETCHALDLAV